MADYGVTDKLAGRLIKDIFDSAERVAELHSCLTSPRGSNFRLRLLQAMEVPLDEQAIERLRVEAAINEYHRHLNRLLRLRLVSLQEADGARQYGRSESGESAVNALREFERRVGAEAAQAVYSAALGPNSIRLFLRIYGNQKEADWDRMQITYTPAEVGRLSLFLPPHHRRPVCHRTSSTRPTSWPTGTTARSHMQPSKARSFYQYLQHVHRLSVVPEVSTNGDSPGVTGDMDLRRTGRPQE